MRLGSALEANKFEIRNARIQNLAAAPATPGLGQVYYDSTSNKFYGWNGSTWIALDSQGTTAPDASATVKGIIQIAGDLAGTAALPVVAASAIDATKISASLKPSGTAVAATEALRALGTTAATAAAGNDGRLSDTRVPTDASVTGGIAGAGVKIAALTITDANVAVAAAIAESKLNLASDAAAGTASRRTLGTGAQQAASGADARLSDQRVPTDASVTGGPAGTGVKIAAATVTAANIAAATITDAQVAVANKDGLVGVASLRTLGAGAQQAAAGNDARFHSQNTDTGTTSPFFSLVGIAATDIRLKKEAAGIMAARLGDDSGYADFKARDVTVGGNLTVQGTTTTINSNTLAIGDNIIVLNNDVLTAAATTENGGVQLQRFTGANVSQDMSNIWVETDKRWELSIPASAGTGVVTKISAMKHFEILGVITAGTAYTVTHSLNTRDVMVSVRDTTTNEIVYVDVVANTVDTVQITFGASFATGLYAVTVVG